jgi:valyl-tRNA synthetase
MNAARRQGPRRPGPLRRPQRPPKLLARNRQPRQRGAVQNNVGFSERADVPIEPRLSEQWFLKYPSVEKALEECVATAEMKFTPTAGPRSMTTG